MIISAVSHVDNMSYANIFGKCGMGINLRDVSKNFTNVATRKEKMSWRHPQHVDPTKLLHGLGSNGENVATSNLQWTIFEDFRDLLRAFGVL